MNFVTDPYGNTSWPYGKTANCYQINSRPHSNQKLAFLFLAYVKKKMNKENLYDLLL